MKKKLLLILAIFITFQVFVGFVTPSKGYAAICCGGTTCADMGATTACTAINNTCGGKVAGDACTLNTVAATTTPFHINITPPDAVKITDFGKLFSGAVGLLLLIAFIMSFLYLVLGGISWVTSGGDKAAVEAARNKILAALIGLIIVAATWALFQLIGGAIGFNILGGFKIPVLY